MEKKKTLSAEDVEKATALYLGGHSAATVASAVGTTPAVLTEALRDAGVAIRKRGRPSKALLALRESGGVAPSATAPETNEKAAPEAPEALEAAPAAVVEATAPEAPEAAPEADGSDSGETEVDETDRDDSDDSEPVDVSDDDGDGEVRLSGGFHPGTPVPYRCIDPLDGSVSVRYRVGRGALMATPELALKYRF